MENKSHKQRISHNKDKIANILSGYQSGSAVAIETIGYWYWYWIADEIEQAGMTLKLAHARKAKLMPDASRINCCCLDRVEMTWPKPGRS